MSNFWTATVNPKNSWLAKKLIKMRREVFTWKKMRVGNGRIVVLDGQLVTLWIDGELIT